MTDRIVVGTDGSVTAGHAVEEAARWARALNCELHIVSAYEPSHGAGVAPVGPVLAPGVPPEVDRRDHGVESILTAAAGAVDVAVTTHAVPGKPADALLEVASDVEATLIVVGSRGMHGVRRALGSVPNAVSHGARCNVLIVLTD